MLNRLQTCMWALSLFAAATASHATWSIILIDTRTREVAVGSATCLTGFDLRANTPVLLVGIGGATAQSAVDSTSFNRVFIRDGLGRGARPDEIITGLESFDGASHQSRQYGIVDVHGRAATFSGTDASAWAGGITGTFAYTYAGKTGTIAYAIQGNLLTGAPVVNDALAAAISTPGDVAARLMASMEAARAVGGDARCSCSGNPCPPPNFTKSAHIAYMLIGRAGDRDGTVGAYRVASGVPSGLAHGDFTGDGLLDVVVGNTNHPSVHLFTNSTPAGQRFTSFLNPSTAFSQVSPPAALAVADLNGDSHPDVVGVHTAQSTGFIRFGRGMGAFDPSTPIVPGTNPGSVAVADLNGQNGPDIVVANQGSSNVSIYYNMGGGEFAAPVTSSVGPDPRSVLIIDTDGNGTKDIVVANRSSSRITVLRNDGTGVFTVAPFITTPATPVSVAAGDLDHDGDTDFAVACQGAGFTMAVMLRNTAGGYTSQTHALNAIPIRVLMGDVNGDTHTDLTVVSSTGGFRVFLNNGAGVFSVAGTYTLGRAANDAALADYDRDGDLDLCFSYQSTAQNGIAVLSNNGDGYFGTGLGCATGDYFMTFNVANQQQADPDPVFTLRAQYDAWRADLIGRPDAVQSNVDAPVVTRASAPGAPPHYLAVSLRDWRGVPITASIQSIRVEHVGDSVPVVGLGAPISIGSGEFVVPIHPTMLAGEDRVRIIVDDGIRKVVLMPETVIHSVECAADADAEGGVTIEDLLLYLMRYELGSLAADLDDGTGLGVPDAGVGLDDLLYFLSRFEQGC